MKKPSLPLAFNAQSLNPQVSLSILFILLNVNLWFVSDKLVTLLKLNSYNWTRITTDDTRNLANILSYTCTCIHNAFNYHFTQEVYQKALISICGFQKGLTSHTTKVICNWQNIPICFVEGDRLTLWLDRWIVIYMICISSLSCYKVRAQLMVKRTTTATTNRKIWLV